MRVVSHIILALFPDSAHSNLNEMQWGVYDHFKSLTIGNDIPSQVVHQTTMGMHMRWAILR